MHFDNDIHEDEQSDAGRENVRFDAYFQMAERLRAHHDDIELLKKLYKSVPQGHKFELLVKCASLPSASQCFTYLFEALHKDLKQSHQEADLAKVLDCLMENNCVNHLEQSFDGFNIQQCRLVNSVVVGVDKMSHEAVQTVLRKSTSDVAASALNRALNRTLKNPKYYEMVKTIAPLCESQHLPDVIYSTMSEHFKYFDQEHSLGVVEEFVVSLEPKIFKKVYQKIHPMVKEYNIEVIKARNSKDKMLVQLDGMGQVDAEKTAARRKM